MQDTQGFGNNTTGSIVLFETYVQCMILNSGDLVEGRGEYIWLLNGSALNEEALNEKYNGILLPLQVLSGKQLNIPLFN